MFEARGRLQIWMRKWKRNFFNFNDELAGSYYMSDEETVDKINKNKNKKNDADEADESEDLKDELQRIRPTKKEVSQAFAKLKLSPSKCKKISRMSFFILSTKWNKSSIT